MITRAALRTTDFSRMTTGESIPRPTPGDILLTEFMQPLNLSARSLARDLDIPANRVTGIINGDRGITAETAILLARRLGTTAEFWMNLQTAHDLEHARARMNEVA